VTDDPDVHGPSWSGQRIDDGAGADPGHRLGSPAALARLAGSLLVTLGAAVAVSLSGTATASAASVSGDPVSIVFGTTIGPGSLVISVADNQVTLSPPVLNASGTLFTTSGALQPITVTDNRTGDPGWTLSGVLSGVPGNAITRMSQFGGQDLGWAPSLATESPVQAITLGLKVKPAPGSGSGVAGLAQSRTLAFTDTGFGLGSAQLGATLYLDLPTITISGTYTVTLTLTAI